MAKQHIMDETPSPFIEHETQLLGGMLRCAREHRGLSQTDLAQLCGLSPKTLSLVECGQRNLLWSTLILVLRELQFKVVFCPSEVKPPSDSILTLLLRMAPDIKELSVILNRIEQHDECNRQNLHVPK